MAIVFGQFRFAHVPILSEQGGGLNNVAPIGCAWVHGENVHIGVLRQGAEQFQIHRRHGGDAKHPNAFGQVGSRQCGL